MTNHLPECEDQPPCDDCICYRLRACEQRVREEESRNVIGSVSLAAIGEANVQQYQLGFATALDAARDAVAAQGIVTANLVRLDATLAAIDALKGES